MQVKTINKKAIPVVAYLLLPLFAFLLLSCPVKKSLLSSFLADNAVPMALQEVEKGETVSLAGGSQNCLSCDVYIAEGIGKTSSIPLVLKIGQPFFASLSVYRPQKINNAYQFFSKVNMQNHLSASLYL